MYLIAGLGNPGQQYKADRHNAGFQVVRRFSKQLGVELGSRRFQSKSALTAFRQKKVILLCPQTFMNRSGWAVKPCADYFRIVPADILVVHDDLDLPVGRIKMAAQGGAGGHKGVLSIMEHMGTGGFARLKIGIGRPRFEEPVEDFVLHPFYPDEQPIVARVMQTAVEACELFLTAGIEQSMNRINPLGKRRMIAEEKG